MPSTRDIRRRIKSIKNTGQITRAMQLVAAAKMKKAQDQALSGRPYADALNEILVNLKERVLDTSHPFFVPGAGKTELIVVITTDKGLCGGLNTNLLRRVLAAAPADAEFVGVGRKGSQSLSRLKKNLIAEFTVKDPARFAELRTIGRFVQERFSSGTYSSVKVAFSNFVNTVTLVPTIETLLPINPVTLGGKKSYEGMGSALEVKEAPAGPTAQYTFEPNAAHVFDIVLPQYVNNTLYQMLLEARASEHSSRMVAMKNATDNAKQIVKDLTLEYNKLRQAAITNELLEISTAKLALG
jgi:F-type H+-transporting ATPase subunit gamma